MKNIYSDSDYIDIIKMLKIKLNDLEKNIGVDI
jgi:hypothetical protein